jgi:hypothetical protein
MHAVLKPLTADDCISPAVRGPVLIAIYPLSVLYSVICKIDSNLLQEILGKLSVAEIAYIALTQFDEHPHNQQTARDIVAVLQQMVIPSVNELSHYLLR